MTEFRLSKPEEVIEALNRLPNHFIFRGQANADWKLESSLERILGADWCADEARKYETFSLALFKSKFHLYDREKNLEPDSILAWLALMQHYGVPTRLLDFTDSPYVALYFALETYNPRSGTDLAVYALDYRSVMDASVEVVRRNDRAFQYPDEKIHECQDQIFEQFIDPRAYELAWVTEPRKHNQRLDRQGGCFLLSGNRDRRIEEVLAGTIYAKCNFIKFRITGTLYQNLFTLLKKVNLTGKVIYGDLHGLATAVRMEVTAYASVAPSLMSK